MWQTHGKCGGGDMSFLICALFPFFFSLIRFWRRAPRHLQGQVQLLGVSKDISTTLEFSKNMSSLSVFSKNNSPLSVVCKEYLRCSACSKNITPPLFSVYGKIFPYFSFPGWKGIVFGKIFDVTADDQLLFSAQCLSLIRHFLIFKKVASGKALTSEIQEIWKQKSRRSKLNQRVSSFAGCPKSRGCKMWSSN